MSVSEKTRIINVSAMAQTPVAQTQSVDLLWQVKFRALGIKASYSKRAGTRITNPPGRELRCVGLAADPGARERLNDD